MLVSVTSQVTLAVENAKLHSELVKQRDVERDLGRARVPAEQVTYQNQVRRTGNRKKLSDPLDCGQNDDLNQVQ